MAFFILSVAGCGSPEDGDWGVSLAPEASWRDGSLVLESPLQVTLSPAALEALEHGVGLVLVVTTRISRRHGPVARLEEARDYPLEIRYLPLSRHWQLSEPAIGQIRSFPRRWMLMEALGEVRRFETGLARSELGTANWQVQVRVRLDRNALPAPMHLPAWLSPQWRLVSRWYTWRFDAA